jgi:HEAT repeat protein
VARILDREIESGGMDDDDVEFRKYLAYALGEFDVEEGGDVLLKAAQTQRDPREAPVRDAALQALAIRIYNLRERGGSDRLFDPQLERVLLRLAGDEDAAIRFQAAFALGHLGTPAAIEQLEVMVDDPHADTRYNAAIALAHRGNERAVETLAEMLDLAEMTNDLQDRNANPRALHRGMIVRTAIAATKELAEKNPDADLSLVAESLEQLAGADTERLEKVQLPPQVVTDARDALKTIQRNTAATTP